MRARLSIVVAASTLAASVALGAPGTAPAPAATPAPAPAATLTYGQASGVKPLPDACGDPNPTLVAVAMQHSALLGAKMIRCDLSWWIVQPTRPTWNWLPYDNVVTAATYFGMNVLFTPQFSPPWARPHTIPPGTLDPSHLPPVKLSDYVNFVHRAADRYAPTGTHRPAGLLGSVQRWEIWNEPNIPGFWNPVNPKRYAAMLKMSYRAIKAVDPAATVISVGLAPATAGNGQVPVDVFVTALGNAGALRTVDGIGIHPYTFPAFASEQISWNPLVNHIPKMEQVLVRFGRADLKFWATEVGWPTSSHATRTIRTWDHHLQVGTESWQNFALADLYKTWYRYSYAGPLVLYVLRDKCINLASWWCSMGVERTDASHKPAYATVHTILTKPLGSL